MRELKEFFFLNAGCSINSQENQETRRVTQTAEKVRLKTDMPGIIATIDCCTGNA